MDVPRNSADSRSIRTHPSIIPIVLLFCCSVVVAAPGLLKEGDIHRPFHGRDASAKEESLGTTKLFERPKSTILNLRSEGVVPVRTTFYEWDRFGKYGVLIK
jgi:hypothetical protein